ncbi:MAG TPA: hypothetical protein VNJ08_10430 [Bacteriovoracaceae bacterium]|nr:hypothetical protein [Bacteriovoracaceae bacterium]
MLKYLLILFIIVPGCASFVKTSEEPKGNISSEKNFEGSNNISFDVAFQAGNTIHSSKDAHEAEIELARKLRRYLASSLGNRLRESSIEVVSTNYYIEGHARKIWWWCSTATLGIIPFWNNSKIHFKAKLIKNGKTIHEVYFKDSYLVVQQTLLVFLMFKSVKNAHEHVGKIQIDRFVDELIQKQLI